MSTPRTKKKKPEEINRDAIKALEMSSEDWQEFEHGVTLFNNRQFWHAHEAWEQVWQRHREDERLFLQGLIQLAAAYHHLISQRSFQGMMNNFDKAFVKLEIFQPEYLGISIAPLLHAIENIKQEADRNDNGEFETIDLNIITKLQFRKPVNPDAIVGIRSVISSEQFQEGVTLFNDGYHWEAHEAWESLWREEEGDGKIFIEAFVQMAGGYNFVKLSKFDNVRYLFTKAIEKLLLYEYHQCGLPLGSLITAMQDNLNAISARSHNGTSAHAGFVIPTINFEVSK